MTKKATRLHVKEIKFAQANNGMIMPHCFELLLTPATNVITMYNVIPSTPSLRFIAEYVHLDADWHSSSHNVDVWLHLTSAVPYPPDDLKLARVLSAVDGTHV